MRGRFAVVAAAVCAVLITGCASSVAGSGLRGSDVAIDSSTGQGSGASASGSGSGQVSTGPVPSNSSAPGSDQPSAPSDTSPVRPIPPIVTSSQAGSSGGAGSQGSSIEPPPSSDVVTTGPTTTPNEDTPTTSDATNPGGASPADEFQGATKVDPAQFSGLVTDIGFQSPSGNIRCGIQDGVVVCQIDKYTYTPPAHDCGDSGWGFNFKLASKSAELFCAGDMESGGPTLKYGQMIVIRDDRCVSRQDGVVCENTVTGYGFRLSKESYVFFGPNDVATTVGAGGTSAPAAIPSALVGQWNGHGRSVTVAADGTSTLTYRVYQFCSDDPTPPCDKTKGNEIISGGLIEFRLLAPKGDSAATGSVTKSNDPKTPVGTAVTATVSGYNLELSFWPDVPFCASNTPSDKWNCGA